VPRFVEANRGRGRLASTPAALGARGSTAETVRCRRTRARLSDLGLLCERRKCLEVLRRSGPLAGRPGSSDRSRRAPCRRTPARRGSRHSPGRRPPSAKPGARRGEGRHRAPPPKQVDPARGHGEESLGLLRRGDSLAAAAHGWESQMGGGFMATSPPSTARRKITRSGMSALRIVDGSRPAASGSSTIRWTSRCWTSQDAAGMPPARIELAHAV
jgi:hypothetical protein